MKKSMAELEAIRQATLNGISLRKDARNHTGALVSVAMGTCGIAAGARDVTIAFMNEIDKNELKHVTLVQTAREDVGDLAPLVDVTLPGAEKVTYVHMNAEKVARVVAEHIIGGTPVEEYTVGAAK